VSRAARISAKHFMFEGVGMWDMSEGGAEELEAATVNCGMKMGYQRWVELNEFMCGIDGRVMEEVPKRKVRDVDRF
jgi:hypothetical protein